MKVELTRIGTRYLSSNKIEHPLARLSFLFAFLLVTHPASPSYLALPMGSSHEVHGLPASWTEAIFGLASSYTVSHASHAPA